MIAEQRGDRHQGHDRHGGVAFGGGDLPRWPEVGSGWLGGPCTHRRSQPEERGSQACEGELDADALPVPTQIAKGEPGKVSRSPLECGSHHTCLVETAYKSVSSEHDLSRGRGREPRAGLWAAHVDGTRAESCVHALAKVHASVHLPPLRSVARVYNFAPGPHAESASVACTRPDSARSGRVGCLRRV